VAASSHTIKVAKRRARRPDKTSYLARQISTARNRFLLSRNLSVAPIFNRSKVKITQKEIDKG
jgi:hypothetical protein